MSKDVDKMYTYLKGYFDGAQLTNSLRALQYARNKHEGQTRKSGEPYIIHPLSMACYAVSLGLRDDDIMSTLLLHDVCEDCGVKVEDLPFNSVIKNGVRYMTVEPFDTDKDKYETKRRYYNELLENKEACICKAFDRYNNLSTMVGTLSEDAIAKNIAETKYLLLPILKKAKNKWIDQANLINALRDNIQSLNSTLDVLYCDKTKNYELFFVTNAEEQECPF